jgi:hypothetical protein
MAATQIGTGSLTLGAPATAAAATIITMPAGAIVRSVRIGSGGAPITEDIMDGDGAFHTSIWYEKRQDTAVIVVVGADYTQLPGTVDPLITDYEIMSVEKDYSRGPIRSTITVKKIVLA